MELKILSFEEVLMAFRNVLYGKESAYGNITGIVEKIDSNLTSMAGLVLMTGMTSPAKKPGETVQELTYHLVTKKLLQLMEWKELLL